MPSQFDEPFSWLIQAIPEILSTVDNSTVSAEHALLSEKYLDDCW